MIDKREVRRTFKEKKTAKGVFAVRCTVTGEVWVGSSANLDSSRTGIWFMLRNGMHHNKAMQAAWNTHGADVFQYEVLENFEEDVSSMQLSDLLRDRQKHWRTELGAAAI
jgi:hypothetical protein